MTTKRASRRVQRIGTPRAAQLLGITPAQFRTLMSRLKIKPLDYYANPHYRSAAPCPLWSEPRVRALLGRPALAAAKQAAARCKEGRARKPAERAARLRERYPDWQDALLAAAEALFNLNRYAKWRECSREHRATIYELKEEFICLLCRLGLAERVAEHVVPVVGIRCRACGGWASDGDASDEEECQSCSGTGWWRSPDSGRYLVFDFSIRGKRFSWHQPSDLVTWPVTVTGVGQEWRPDPEPKPVGMRSSKFADAKALLRFVLDSATRPDRTAADDTARPLGTPLACRRALASSNG
jgi:hypothetical protein